MDNMQIAFSKIHAMFNAGKRVQLFNMIDSDSKPFDEDVDTNFLGGFGTVEGADPNHEGRVIVLWDIGESDSYIPRNLSIIE